MYAQSDADGNEYLILDLLIDYEKDNNTISLSDQEISAQGRPVSPLQDGKFSNSVRTVPPHGRSHPI